MRPWMVALVALVLPASGAALQVEKTPEELCRVATAVALAEVTGLETRWADGSEGLIETVADLAVDRVLLGHLEEDSRVVTPGGAHQGLVLTVEDAAVLHPDRRYLLLLAPRPDGAWRVVGGAEGAIPVPWDDHERAEQRAIDALGGCLAR